MMKRGILSSKKGDTLILEPVLFITLNTLFFVVMLLFVWRASSGAIVYEQAYAKQIALAIDDAKPGTIAYLNMQEAIDLAKSSKGGANPTAEEVLGQIVKLDTAENRIIVSLTKSGGYSFQYFSDYDVKVEPFGLFLKIEVQEKQTGGQNAD